MRHAIACGTLIVLALALSGCATIMGKSQRPVTITSEPDGAEISIANHAGKTVYEGRTPTTITLKAGRGYFKGENYVVRFAREGYVPRETAIARKTNGWYVGGNFVFGGLIGWLIVDPATGAMWKLEDVHMALEPDLRASHQEGRLNILELDDVPEELRGSLVPLN